MLLRNIPDYESLSPLDHDIFDGQSTDLYTISFMSDSIMNHIELNNIMYMMQYSYENTRVFSITPHTAEMYIPLHRKKEYIVYYTVILLRYLMFLCYSPFCRNVYTVTKEEIIGVA